MNNNNNKYVVMLIIVYRFSSVLFILHLTWIFFIFFHETIKYTFIIQFSQKRFMTSGKQILLYIYVYHCDLPIRIFPNKHCKQLTQITFYRNISHRPATSLHVSLRPLLLRPWLLLFVVYPSSSRRQRLWNPRHQLLMRIITQSSYPFQSHHVIWAILHNAISYSRHCIK